MSRIEEGMKANAMQRIVRIGFLEIVLTDVERASLIIETKIVDLHRSMKKKKEANKRIIIFYPNFT